MRFRGLRRLHRLATLVVGAQLLIWTFTGFSFTWFDFAAVRGTRDRAPDPPLAVDEVRLSVADAVAAARAGGDPARTIAHVELTSRRHHPAWAIAFSDGSESLVDARDGRALPAVGESEASEIAVAAFARPVRVREAQRVERTPDLDGPAIRVRLDEPGATEVFVSPSSGRILAWRNRSWRAFDRLWSLHVLGYVSRDNPAHAPLRVLGALALLATLSGAGLWLSRARRVTARAEGFDAPTRSSTDRPARPSSRRTG
jgi:uncharacterized iron-regulated membrane protein